MKRENFFEVNVFRKRRGDYPAKGASPSFVQSSVERSNFFDGFLESCQ